MALALASSSSSSPATHNHNQHQWKKEVFLNFRGEDTRDTFISHLLVALLEKGVDTFIDDRLHRGDEIAPTLLQAIQESNVAVVVFSQDYASSSWCLDELVKIMECRETHGQIVMPVFYHVDPDDVMKQSGSFAEAFDRERKRNFEINADKVPKWKAALTGAANLSGWDSKVFRSEHELINQIVNDVLKELNQASSTPTGLEHLVGINSHLELIKDVLSIGSLDVRILGIWGMGGIGKTTIAEAIFSQVSCQFEGCCFLNDVREESEKSGMKKLLKQLVSQALDDSEIKIYGSSIGLHYKRRLYLKQILVVLDDVDHPSQLESLVGDPCWFGPGSRIIVTSRNKHAFKRRADYIYEVKPLEYYLALQLFSQNAFKKNHPPENYKLLSNLGVNYCQGNPLALEVLGSFLFDKEKNEWESAMDKLKKLPMNEIQSVLKISYDGLDREEKEIFLHIACFFIGERTDFVKQILKSYGFSIDIGIRVLSDKSLITTITLWDGLVILGMHDLLKEMGKEIVRNESKEPGERSRLWDYEEICEVFRKNTGTRKVEGIFLNMSEVGREIHLNPKAFENMLNLKLLKVYNSKYYLEGLKEEDCKVYLSQGLDFLPDELRYLYWYRYPLKYLPANFHGENLAWIELPYSNIEGLEKEAKPENIFNHFSSLRRFSIIRCLRLVNCKELMSLPNNIDMRCLDTLDLTGCSKLEVFPDVSRNIEYLELSWTAIKEVPASVECLHRLLELNLSFCSELQSLPTNICKLACLKSVKLLCCFKLKKFPEILETMDNLEELDLRGTSLEELPSSVDRLKGLTSLNFASCIFDSESRRAILRSLYGSTSLSVGDCNLSELPAVLSYLKALNLGESDFEAIPESIKQLTQLQRLDMGHCKNLRSLPELLASLVRIHAMGWSSVENISSLNQLLFETKSLDYTFDLSYCFKVDKNERDPISQFSYRYFARQLKDSLGGQCLPSRIFVCYTGVRIPEWFEYQSTGDSVRIPLPSNWLNDRFLGFALCLVVETYNIFMSEIICYCRFGYLSRDRRDSTFALNPIVLSKRQGISVGERTKHVVLFYDGRLYNRIAEHRPHLTQFSYDAVWLKFVLGDHKVKKCGAIPLYAKDEEYNSRPVRWPKRASWVDSCLFPTASSGWTGESEELQSD